MENFIQILRDYVREHRIVFDQDCPQPCLEALWWIYGEYHNMDNENIKNSFRTLHTKFETLLFLDSDAIFSEISRLCIEYERNAFTAGLKLGVQLMMELRDT